MIADEPKQIANEAIVSNRFDRGQSGGRSRLLSSAETTLADFTAVYCSSTVAQNQYSRSVGYVRWSLLICALAATSVLCRSALAQVR